MEPESELEDVRDYVRRNGHGDMALCLLLEKFWPEPSRESADMSGMLCFVALYRFLYWRIFPRDKMDDMIRQTGILRFAMSHFGSGKPEARPKEEEACQLMHASLTEHVGGQPTFARLVESEMLLKSVWSLDPFRLYLPIMWRPSPESPEWNCLSEDPQELVGAKESLIVWRTAEHANITDAINACNGIFKGGLEGIDAEAEYSLLFRAPAVIRVMVRCNGPTEGLTLPQIREISLPETHASTKSIGAKTDTAVLRETTFEIGPGVLCYRITAIVRLRARPSEQDYVRFYTWRGETISPANWAQPGLQRYFDNDWSIQDPDHSLMLYYEYCGYDPDGPSHPDVVSEHVFGQPGPLSAPGMPATSISGSERDNLAHGTPPEEFAVQYGDTGAGIDDGTARTQRSGSKSDVPDEPNQQLTSDPGEEQPGMLTENILPTGHTNWSRSTVLPKQNNPNEESARGTFLRIDWDDPSSPGQGLLDYDDPPRDTPLSQDTSAGLQIFHSQYQVGSDEARPDQPQDGGIDGARGLLLSPVAHISPVRVKSEPDDHGEDQRTLNSRPSVQDPRLQIQLMGPSPAQAGGNGQYTDAPTVQRGLGNAAQSSRNHLVPPGLGMQQDARESIRDSTRARDAIGRDPKVGSVLRKRSSGSMTDAFTHAGAKRPNTGLPVVSQEDVSVKREMPEPISNVRPHDSAATSTNPPDRVVSQPFGVFMSMPDAYDDDEDDIFESVHRERLPFAENRYINKAGVDLPATREPAMEQAKPTCQACGSSYHSTRNCHIPGPDGTTVICPFHDVSMMKATAGDRAPHVLDGQIRYHRSSGRRPLYCMEMMKYEDAERNGSDKYKTCLERAFKKFVIERRRKPFCRVVQKIHCPIEIAIRYSEVFCQGQVPPEMKDGGWPYTKRDATNPEIVAKLRACERHNWRDMPEGELDSMGWSKIKNDYRAGDLEPQIHYQKPKRRDFSARAR